MSNETKMQNEEALPHLTINKRENAKGRAGRLKQARGLTRLSTREIAEKYSYLNAVTFRGWEACRHGGLTEKGALKVIKMLAQEGVHCTLQWLLYGVGNGPQLVELKDNIEIYNEHVIEKQEKAILLEIEYFRQQNINAVDFIINDDGMQPLYMKSEYVAGIAYSKRDIDRLIGRDCIMQTQSGEKLLRRLHSKTDEKKYTLTCINPETQIRKPTLYNIELNYAAFVIWHRRKL